jgi:hypothetical protein
LKFQNENDLRFQLLASKNLVLKFFYLLGYPRKHTHEKKKANLLFIKKLPFLTSIFKFMLNIEIKETEAAKKLVACFIWKSKVVGSSPTVSKISLFI